jgi:opacity protein-like surface antigen
VQDTHTSAFANHDPSVQTYKGDVYTIMTTTGYALDDKTDCTLEYSYSRSDNFSDNSAAGLPLGLDFRRHALIAGVSRKISKNVIARLRYGFYDYDEPSTGGINNYTAHLVNASCTVHF